METDQLRGLAEKLHKRYGKTYHNPKEAMSALELLLEDNPSLEATVLMNLASQNLGNGKQHVSGKGVDSELMKGFIRPPRSSRRRGSERNSKLFSRIR